MVKRIHVERYVGKGVRKIIGSCIFSSGWMLSSHLYVLRYRIMVKHVYG